MKKLSILFASLFTLLASGCAEDDKYVSSFEAMGCSSSFGDIVLGRNISISGTYPNEVVVQLNCNSNTQVTINFYDNGYPGHYRYFLVNNTPVTYVNTIYRNYSGTATGSYTFTTDPLYNSTYDSFYGIYEVEAYNLETGEYTVRQYLITAYENSILSKNQAAVSNLKARPAPLLSEADNNKTTQDNITLDNKTEELKLQDNEANQ